MSAPATRQEAANYLEERIAAAQRRVLWSSRQDSAAFRASLRDLQLLVAQLEQTTTPPRDEVRP